jgi:small-conductance mechanosensitive channel/CRP-like cAMP-binding protein
MPTSDLISDAALFAAAGLLLALAAGWLRRDLRKQMARMAITTVAGLGVLVLVAHFGASLPEGPLVAVLREASLAVLAFGVARITVLFAFRAAFARFAVPQILADVLMALLLLVFAFSRMNAVGFNLAGIVTTSAVITGVIAFSLQETLGNLWGGISLQLDNTCRIGDWIRIENTMGQVVGIRWRCVAVATNFGETVMIPNSMLIKSRVMVLARRGDARTPWRRDVEFVVSYSTPPARVVAAVEAALARAEIPFVAKQPRPDVLHMGYGENGCSYVVRYWLTDLQQDVWTDSQIRLHVTATLARHRMEIPYPHRVWLRGKPYDSIASRELAAREATLERLDLFQPLTAAERASLAADLADFPYVADDVIARQGDPADSLFILSRGRVGVYDDGTGGARRRLATLEAPGYFGEMGLLTGQARGATIIAENEVLCYRLDKAGFDEVLKARPELVEALSNVVSARQAANDATLQTLSDEARARQAVGRTTELVRRIRRFFALA